MRYAIVIERADGHFSAYVPDLTDCTATGTTPQEVEANIRDAIASRLEASRQHGTPLPRPTSQVQYVDVSA